MFRTALVGVMLLPAVPAAAGDPVLGLPIACDPGNTCYIQNLVDRDPGPGFRDYACGALGYDGHKGTDFGVATMAEMRRGVDVVASAPGVVQGIRDGVADVGPTDDTPGQECGNGVLLRHGEGWETQYCHMKSGSVLVRNGQRVARGAVLGQVGFSGLSEFPHVHLSVRRDGEIVDPFDLSAFPSCGEGGRNLWAEPPEYTSGGLLDAGFHPGIPTYAAVEDGSAATPELTGDAAGLVLFGLGFSGQKGDVMVMRITGPQGVLLAKSIELDRDQARFFRAAGKRLTRARWPAGRYFGVVTLSRDGDVLGERRVEMDIR